MDTSNFFRTEADLALGEARKEKASRTKEHGSPIELASKAIKIEVRGDNVWTAESGGLARKYSLETGKLLQSFRGHTGPVTCLAFFPSTSYLFTGSWDKTIRVWDISDGVLLSSTIAHSDFLKCLVVIPSLNLLISGGSDRTIRFWDLSELAEEGRISQVGSVSEHSRPVECLSFDTYNSGSGSAVLFSADSMGVIKVWNLIRDSDPKAQCRVILKFQLDGHRTGINDMWYGCDQLWSASTDCDVLVHDIISGNEPKKSHRPIELKRPVKSILPLALTVMNEPLLVVGSGEDIVSFDVSELDRPEQKGIVDAHWHDVTALRLWVKRSNSPSGFEPVIVSASLDGTIRRWSLKEVLSPPRAPAEVHSKPGTDATNTIGITDAELDELLGTDEE